MIINNLTRNNHLYHIQQAFKNAKRVFIISPFITKNINLFDFTSLESLEKITIVTTLKPFDKDQYSKVKYFKELYNLFNSKNVHFEIFIDNSLHGKIFIGEIEEDEAKAIITSANFTDSGLRINNEWGILIDDIHEINSIKNGIISKIKYKGINENKINSFISEIEENPKPKVENNPIQLNLSNLFDTIENYFNVDNKTTFWLKPIGVTNDIVSITRKFDEVDSNLHFSKLKSKGVKRGDILICYAVSHLNILSIYRVNSEIKKTENKDDRWPYYFVGENLTPNYGREWSKHDITITNQKNLILSQNLFNITPSGINSFGSLMRGADKLRLTNEFGSFILNKITQLNDELKRI